ncbi:MAG: PAS domain S-box protein [Spirochaetales bacterium]|nr:PAS domain S-box protein [Spirochaetales bacterium]
MNKINKEDESEKIISSVPESNGDSLFLSVFNNNQAIMLLVDPENNQKVLDANEAALKFYGYTREQILKLDMGSINTKSMAERNKLMKKAKKLPHSYYQFEHKTSSGLLKSVEVNASSVEYNNKKVFFIIVHDISELKRSNEQFELAMAGSNLGLWDWWVENGDLKINERWAEILGYSLEEIFPVTNNIWRNLCHPDDLSVIDTQFHKYLRKEIDIYRADLRMKHKDGYWVWIQTQGKVFEWTEDGQPLRVAGTHLDINEKKRTALELVESEAKFRSFFDNSPLALWVEDSTNLFLYINSFNFIDSKSLKTYFRDHPDDIIKCTKMLKMLEVNPAALKLYEAENQAELISNFGKIFTIDSINLFLDILGSIYDNIPLKSYEIKNRTLKGKEISIKIEHSNLSKYKTLTTITDITEQKNIADKLAANEKRYRSFFESSPLALWEEDFTDVIAYLNKLPVSCDKELRSYLEKHPEEVNKCLEFVKVLNMNQATLDLYEIENREQMINEFPKVFTPSTFESFKEELVFLYRNESTILSLFTDTTFAGNNIDVKFEMTRLIDSKYLATITDITEVNKRESELKKLLEQTKADSETKEILLREINHRVKNNLSSFIGMLYAEKKQSGSDLDAVQMEHVDNLINRIKGISIAHEMLSRSQWAPISVYKLAEKIIHSLNHLIPRDRIIDVKLKPSNIFLDADQSHSTAILLNELFSNSIEHASHPGETIEVEIEIKEKKGTIFLLYRDSGPGYSEEILKSEFKNVGMYLIKNIVEQSLRGTFQISNKNGAKIEIEFPGGSKLEEL